MSFELICKREDCKFNYINRTCNVDGYLTITENGCETYESKDLLREDIIIICSELLPNYHSIMPQEFYDGIANDVMECSDFYSGTYNDSDIKLAIEREIASRYGIEI